MKSKRLERKLKKEIQRKNKIILKLIICIFMILMFNIIAFLDMEERNEITKNNIENKNTCSISDLKNIKYEIDSQLNKIKEFKIFCNNIKENIEILNRIVEAEVTGGTIQQKENVCEVVLNRVYSNKFPDTIKEVVFQRNQFQPTFDGRYYKVKIQKSTRMAVQNCLSNYQYNESHSPLFFMAEKYAEKDNVNWFKKNLELCYNDGVHSFYK